MAQREDDSEDVSYKRAVHQSALGRPSRLSSYEKYGIGKT